MVALLLLAVTLTLKVPLAVEVVLQTALALRDKAALVPKIPVTQGAMALMAEAVV
jgi:hypothetical protein